MQSLLHNEWQQLGGQPIPTLPAFQYFEQDILPPSHLSMQDMASPSLVKQVDDELKHTHHAKTVQLSTQDPVAENLLEWIQFWCLQFTQHLGYLDLLLASSSVEKKSPNDSPMFGTLPLNQPNISPEEGKKLAFAANLVTQLEKNVPNARSTLVSSTKRVGTSAQRDQCR